MEKLDACPVCGGRSPGSAGSVLQNLGTVDVPFAKIPATIRVEYSICRLCGVVFQNPRMTQAELNEYYGSGAYRETLTMSQEDMDKDELERANRLGDFMDARAGSTAILQGHLDIGSSRGYFLSRMMAAHQVGIEPNRAYNQGKQVIAVPSKSSVVGAFELISLIHTLEHVLDPVGELKWCAEHLKLGGRVLIEVPSDMSPGGPLRLAHTFYFQVWSLATIVDKAGLKPTLIAHTPHLLMLCEAK